MIALDTETCLIAPALQAPPLVCVSLDAGAWCSLMHWTQSYDYLKDLLTRENEQITGHNISYDMIVIGCQFPDLMPLIFRAYRADRITCTEVRQKILDIAGGVYRKYLHKSGSFVKINYDLASVAKRHLGLELDKDTWRLRYGELRDIPCEQWPQGAREYPLLDAQAARGIHQAQEPNVKYLDDQYRQARGAFWLGLMSTWGIHTDPNAVAELARRTQCELNEITADLQSAGMVRKDGSRDTKLTKSVLVKAYEGRELPLTKKGKMLEKAGSPDAYNYLSLDEDACEKSRNPLLRKYSAYSRKTNILAKDIPAFASRLPLHTRVETMLATGRTSTSDPQTQNLPTGIDSRGVWRPGVRECIVPRPGNVLVSADYSGIELCTLGEICLKVLGHSTLARNINNGIDNHLLVASRILGIPYEQCDKKRHYNQRQTGKVANFGFPGGLGPSALVDYAWGNYGVEITESEAASLKAIWLDTLPEMKDYFRYIDQCVRGQEGGVWSLYSNRFRGDISYTQACNTLFQGLAADIAKDAGFEIAYACYVDIDSPLWGCRIVMFVHDEFVLEVPEERCDPAARELDRIMVRVASKWLPDVKVKTEFEAMRRYSKHAQPVYNAAGKLIPWEEPKAA